MKKTITTTGISILLNITQAIVKCVIGKLAHSNTLFADGLHGISDILTNTIVLIAAYYATIPADNSYPYGRGRYEPLAMLMVSCIIIFASLNMLSVAIFEQGHGQTSMHPLIFSVSLISSLSSLYAFYWMRRVAKQSNSDLIYGNAVHQLADALSSGIVIFTCIADYLGYRGTDAFGTTLVVFMIIYSVLPMLKTSLLELTDHSTESAYLSKLSESIMSNPSIYEIHHLRTRRSGSRVILDVHITLHHLLSFTESHWVAEQLTEKLKEDDSNITDVLIHVDPDVDVLNTLKSRDEYLEHWKDLKIPHEALDPEYLSLLYLKDGIKINWKLHPNIDPVCYDKWAEELPSLSREILEISKYKMI